jgi:hypothetical protein
MDEMLDITLEFERIAADLEAMAPFSELAEDTLRLMIVMANEIHKLQGETNGVMSGKDCDLKKDKE